MKKLCKRIIAGAFAFVTLFFACMSPAHALSLPDISVNVDVVEFGDWLYSGRNTILNYFGSFFDDDICPYSPNTDGRHNFIEQRTQVDGKTGLYYICEYCGKSAGEVAQESYDNYVSELPAISYSSSGELRWRLNISHCDENTTVSVLSFTGGSSFILQYLYEKVNSSATLKIYVDEFIAPVSGTYHLGAFICSSSSRFKVTQYHLTGSTKYHFFSDYSDFSAYRSSNDGIVNGVYYEFPNSLSCVSGSTVVDNTSFGLNCYSGEFYDYGGYIDVICVPVSLPGDIYNITTRPTTITGGNYGIVGDNGQITRIEDNSTIINETNNTYYNPATGQRETILDWSYNYTDRSYNITLESGDTVTVTYGDQNITIVEGDTNYTIYYIVDGSGSGSDPNPGVSSDPEPSTSPDPTPSTSPDPETSLPPAVDDDDDPDDFDDGGLLEWINGLIKYLSDHLSGAVELILSFFRKIPELFGGFLAFLSAMFPFLPDEIMLLLTFGIAAVVFVGIIKAIRR